MKTALGTVLYKQSFKYLNEFSRSVNNQDCPDFDMLFLNDDLDEAEIDISINSIKKKVILSSGKPNSTIPQLRYQLIKYAKENNYDLLALVDFDDTFSENRVSKVKTAFNNEYGFYYNDIYYFYKKNKFFSFLPDYTNEVNQILEQNYLGLSNTAINLSKIDFDLLEKLNVTICKAFDWYMYSVFLAEGHKGKKVDGCRTYYRIYENNTAGECKNTINYINNEINTKINHYSLLKQWDSKYEELYDYYKALQHEWKRGNVDLLSYIDIKNDYWWGLIKSHKVKEVIGYNENQR